MSFKVLVIPEDPEQNGHILKPLVRAIMRDSGRPAAKVQLLTKPRTRGYDHAVKVIRGELPEAYGFMDLWLFFPDADRAKADAMRRLETDLEEQEVSLFCCPAQPEVEIYACAAFRDDLDGTWEDARKHLRLKEDVFQPLLAKHGGPRRPGGGRGLMIEESLRNLPHLLQLCPELQELRDRIAGHLQDR